MPKFESPSLETIKKPLRKVRAAADQAFLDYSEKENPAEGAWETVFDGKQGKFARTKAFFTALRDLVPDKVFQQLAGDRYEYQPDILPVDPKQYEFNKEKIGAGAECNVFKLISLDPNRPSLVIKIDQSGAENVEVLLERGKQVRSEWQEKQAWYKEIPGFVPDEFHFIARAPRGGRNALFTIQEYFGTRSELSDLFHSVSRNRLLSLLQSDTKFRDQFIIFARATLERAEKEDEMIDTLGDSNVVLAERAEGRRLLLLDPHVVKHPKRGSKSEQVRLRAHLDYLQGILDELQLVHEKSEELPL